MKTIVFLAAVLASALISKADDTNRLRVDVTGTNSGIYWPINGDYDAPWLIGRQIEWKQNPWQLDPTNTVLIVNYEPVVAKTNGHWEITFPAERYPYVWDQDASVKCYDVTNWLDAVTTLSQPEWMDYQTRQYHTN